MIALRLAVGVLCLGSTVTTTAAPLRTSRDTTPHPAVCRIAVEERNGKAFGSGTLIDAREQYGLVITNWHVVRDATGKIEVQFPGSAGNPEGFKSEARPLKLDETWDLAALVVWRPPTEPVTLAGRSPAKGEALTICGYGGGDYLSQTGRCTDYYAPEVGQPQDLVELNVEARQGDSGGPIFNSRGQLAGVLFGAAQGTTLGSFGPRVQTFLASLAPNIGTRQDTLLAAAAIGTRQSADRLGSSGAGPVDPFLAAERANPSPSLSPIPISAGLPAVARMQPPVERQPMVPPPALTDRSSAPRLAASRANAEAWQPVPSPSPRDLVPPPTSGRFSGSFAPQTSQGHQTNQGPQASQSPYANDESATPLAVVDWTEDSRTLLAVCGAAALVVAGMRAVS